jgi:hypothetical protein
MQVSVATLLLALAVHWSPLPADAMVEGDVQTAAHQECYAQVAILLEQGEVVPALVKDWNSQICDHWRMHHLHDLQDTHASYPLACLQHKVDVDKRGPAAWDRGLEVQEGGGWWMVTVVRAKSLPEIVAELHPLAGLQVAVGQIQGWRDQHSCGASSWAWQVEEEEVPVFEVYLTRNVKGEEEEEVVAGQGDQSCLTEVAAQTQY